MEIVSTAFQNMLKATIRELMFLKITFGVIDVDAQADGTITAEYEKEYSEAYKIKNEHYFPMWKLPENYCRVYENGFILSGDNYLIPEGGFNQANPTESAEFCYQGYVSEIISNGYGDFLFEKPTITISFDDYYQIKGFTFIFDTTNDNFPTEMTIKSYDGSVLIDSISVSPDSAEYLHGAFTPREGATNKIVISFAKTNFPYRDVRITQLIMGLVKMFDNDSLKSATIEKSVDLINSIAPVDTLTFSVIDLENEYDPENPDGMYALFEEGQSFSCSLGLALDREHKSIEWTKMGQYISTGDVDVSASHIPIATFYGRSLIDELKKEYYKGIYDETPRTLFDLATEIMLEQDWDTDSNGDNLWRFSDKMREFSTNMPIPRQNARDSLLLLAGASCCVLYTGRDGIVYIQPKDYLEKQDFELTWDDILDPPKIKRYPVLKSINVNYNTPRLDTEESELYMQEITEASGSRYFFDYVLSANQRATTDGTLTVKSEVYYAERCILELSGTGMLYILGKVVNLNSNVYKQEYSLYGEECPVSISFIQTQEHAKAYCEFVASYVQLRLLYTSYDRGFPQLDPTDVIDIETKGFGNVRAVISKETWDFDGALHGKMTYYSLGGGAENVD